MATHATTLRLVRTLDDGVQTTGTLYALGDDGAALLAWQTVEKPWAGNRFRESCIPPGRYRVVHRRSRKFGRHLHVTDVEGRSFILIHVGNDHGDIVGCIAPGTRFGHGTGDGRLDVLSSGTAMGQIRARVPADGIWMDVYAPTEDATSARVVVDVDAPVTPARLKLGASGDAVEDLQRALRREDLYGPGTAHDGEIDGDFGPLTDAAVRAFQNARGLVADGVAGPNTIEALGLAT